MTKNGFNRRVCVDGRLGPLTAERAKKLDGALAVALLVAISKQSI